MPGETNVLRLVQGKSPETLGSLQVQYHFLSIFISKPMDFFISLFFKNVRIVLISYYILFAFRMNLPPQKVVTKPLKPKKLYLITKQF